MPIKNRIYRRNFTDTRANSVKVTASVNIPLSNVPQHNQNVKFPNMGQKGISEIILATETVELNLQKG